MPRQRTLSVTPGWWDCSSIRGGSDGKGMSCKIWYSISQTVSDLGNIHDRSIRAFAVKPRAFGAPLSGFGA